MKDYQFWMGKPKSLTRKLDKAMFTVCCLVLLIVLSACSPSTPAYTVGVDTAGKYYNVYPAKGQDPYKKPGREYWYDPAVKLGLQAANSNAWGSVKELFKAE